MNMIQAFKQLRFILLPSAFGTSFDVCVLMFSLSLSLVGFLLISDMLNFHILKTTRK